jgi:hypothetical protein
LNGFGWESDIIIQLLFIFLWSLSVDDGSEVAAG